MNATQEKLFGVIEDESQAQVLGKLWDLLNGAPLQAAKVIRALEQSSEAVQKITTDIPEALQRLDEQCVEADVRRAQFIEDLRKFRKDTLTELSGVVEAVTQLRQSLDSVNDDDVMNKANRIIEVAEKLARLKRDGALELLKKIL